MLRKKIKKISATIFIIFIDKNLRTGKQFYYQI